MKTLSVALVGPIHQENLALAYLAAVARQAGHRAEVVAYSRRSDLEQTLGHVQALAADVVGLGIAFQNNIDDYLVLLSVLRERGYRRAPHVRRSRADLLLGGAPARRCRASTRVVRHDGEETFSEMLALLARGESPRDSPGSSGAKASVAWWPADASPGLDDLDRCLARAQRPSPTPWAA